MKRTLIVTSFATAFGLACADDTSDGGQDDIGMTGDTAATAGDTVDTVGESSGTNSTTVSDTVSDTTDTTASDTVADTSSSDTVADTSATDTSATDTSSSDTGTTTTTTGTTGSGCEAPPSYVDCDGMPGALTNDPWRAIGVNCPGADTETVQAANATMNSNNANAWRVAAQFGSANGQNPNYAVPNYNGKIWAANPGDWTNPDMEVIPSNTSTAILVLSTGVVAAANNQSVVLENNPQTGNGDNGNVDAGGLPVPLSSQRGSNNGMGGTPFMNCDFVNDCSDSLYQWWNVNNWNNPDDKLWMQADLTVPPGTEGFVFDFAYFSSEFPTWYDTQYNDQFIAWSTSMAYTGNLTFVNGAPLTITSLEDAGAFAYKANAPELAQTGFTGNAGTGWFVARGAAVPDEVFQLSFFISDLGDSVLATGVLLDNFRWECAGCIPSEVNSCGIQPQ